MEWTAEMEDAARRMWGNGMSASHIAHQLRTVSRSAVLGKVRRMRLPFRDLSQRRHVSRPRPSPVVKAAPQPSPVLALPPGVELSPTVTFAGLTDTTCRWPIGDPRLPDFGFCGRPPVPGRPYCAQHVQRAVQVRP